jgi:hypothetical protein
MLTVMTTDHHIDTSEANRPPEFSDDALAATFADRHKNNLRYVAAWGRWLISRLVLLLRHRRER